MSSFKHLFVPVDFGEATEAAIDTAVTLARALDAQITLAHVFDVTPFVTPTMFAPPLDFEPVVAALEKDLRGVEARARAAWPKLDAAMLRGVAYETIVSAAVERKCDLIVMGTHGRKGLAHVFLGSVAEKVVRLSAVPVLTVHPSR